MAKTKRYPGSIEKRGESYRIRLCVGNKRHYFTLTTKDRRVAEAFAKSKEAELREEAARQAAGLPGALTCTQLFQRFEELHLPKKAPNTQVSYRDALKPLSHFFGKVLGDPPISQIQPAHIEQYLQWRPYHGPDGSDRSCPLSNRTLQLDRAVLHRAFKLARDQGYVDSNPVSPVDVPQPHGRTPVILTDGQLEKLLGVCRTHDFLHLYVLTLAETGARCESEVLWLRWKDVDLAEGFIWINSNEEHRTKSGEGRWVPMTKRLRSAMRKHFAKHHFNQFGPHQSEWVFHHAVTRGKAKAGDRIASLRRSFEKARKAAGLPSDFRQHDLRHRRITTWIAEGKHPVHVKEAVGHANLQTTMKYTHLAKEHLRSLVDDSPKGRRERLGT